MLSIKDKVQHGSCVLRRKGGNSKKASADYAIAYEITELANVAKETCRLDAAYLQGDNDIAPAFLDYVRPLVGKLPKMGRLSDFPVKAG